MPSSSSSSFSLTDRIKTSSVYILHTLTGCICAHAGCYAKLEKFSCRQAISKAVQNNGVMAVPQFFQPFESEDKQLWTKQMKNYKKCRIFQPTVSGVYSFLLTKKSHSVKVKKTSSVPAHS